MNKDMMLIENVAELKAMSSRVIMVEGNEVVVLDTLDLYKFLLPKGKDFKGWEKDNILSKSWYISNKDHFRIPKNSRHEPYTSGQALVPGQVDESYITLHLAREMMTKSDTEAGYNLRNKMWEVIEMANKMEIQTQIRIAEARTQAIADYAQKVYEENLKAMTGGVKKSDKPIKLAEYIKETYGFTMRYQDLPKLAHELRTYAYDVGAMVKAQPNPSGLTNAYMRETMDEFFRDKYPADGDARFIANTLVKTIEEY